MDDRAAVGRRRVRGHAFALALGLLLATPLVTAAVVTSAWHPGGGRMLAVVPPWAPDVEVLDTLARAGAAWAVPLRVPGVWLVERTPVAARAPAPRVVLIPIAEGWSASLGCAAPLPPGRRR